MTARGTIQPAHSTHISSPSESRKTFHDQSGGSNFFARVAIVGAGSVGSTFAYALLLSGLGAEIVLIDKNRAKAEGEAMDLNHAVPFSHPTRLWPGEFSDCAGSAVTVLTAGAFRQLEKQGSTSPSGILPSGVKLFPGLPPTIPMAFC